MVHDALLSPSGTVFSLERATCNERRHAAHALPGAGLEGPGQVPVREGLSISKRADGDV